MSEQAWFSALGEPLGEAEHAEIAAYLRGLAMTAPVQGCHGRRRPASARKRRMPGGAPKSGYADAALIRVAAGAASCAAYQARLACVAGAPAGHPFLRKYALYCGGRWPLSVYEGRFAIF